MRENNPEIAKQKAHDYYLKRKAAGMTYYQRHRDGELKKAAIRYANLTSEQRAMRRVQGRWHSATYRHKHPDKVRDGFLRWLEKNRDYNSQRVKDWHQQLRDELFTLIGSFECTCEGTSCWHNGHCGVKDRRVLQADHVNGLGNADARIRGGRRAMYLYYLLHPEEAREELRVRCANCNWVLKHLNNQNPKPRRYPVRLPQ